MPSNYSRDVIVPELKRNWKNYTWREKPLPPKVYHQSHENNVKLRYGDSLEI